MRSTELTMRDEFSQARAEFYAREEYEIDERSASWAEASYAHVNRMRQIESEIEYEERLAMTVVSSLNDLAAAYQTGVGSENRDTQILAAQMRDLANKIEKRHQG